MKKRVSYVMLFLLLFLWGITANAAYHEVRLNQEYYISSEDPKVEFESNENCTAIITLNNIDTDSYNIREFDISLLEVTSVNGDYEAEYIHKKEFKGFGLKGINYSFQVSLKAGASYSLYVHTYGNAYSYMGDTSFHILISVQDKTPATELTLQKKAVVTAGFKKTLNVRPADPYLYSMPKVKWTSSNKKIATVNSKGVVTAKKAGNCTITCSLNGTKYKCKVTVKNNSYKNKRSYDVLDFTYGEPQIVIRKAYYSGKNLVLNCRVYNNRMFRMTKFDWLKMKVYNADTYKTLVKYKKFNNVKAAAKAYGTTNITLKFPMKKKIDLVNTPIDIQYKYIYTYYTR